MKIAIIGEQCSGKSTIANMILKAKFGRIFKFAQKLYNINDALNIKKDRKVMQRMSEVVKELLGRDYFIREFAAEVKDLSDWEVNQPDTVYLVNDDCRFELEFNYLMDNGWKMVYVEADRDVRMQRASKLGLEFIENHESELGIKALKKKCGYIIDNNGTLEKLKNDLHSAI